MLKQGADLNKRNDAGATALMWAAADLEKNGRAVKISAIKEVQLPSGTAVLIVQVSI